MIHYLRWTLTLELTEVRELWGASVDAEWVPRWVDRTGDEGVELSDDGPPTLPTVVVLPCVEKWWRGFSELVVRRGLFTVREGIHLFIYWSLTWPQSVKKMEIKTELILIILIVFSVSGLWPLAQKEELFYEKNLRTFLVFCFVVPRKLNGTLQNSTKQSSRVKNIKKTIFFFFLDMFLFFFAVGFFSVWGGRDVLTPFTSEYDKILERLCVKSRVVDQARHRHTVLHGSNSQYCARDKCLVFTCELGLSCGRDKCQ